MGEACNADLKCCRMFFQRGRCRSLDIYGKMTSSDDNNRVNDQKLIRLNDSGDPIQTEDGQIIDYSNRANGVITLAKDAEDDIQSDMEKYCIKLLDGVWAGKQASVKFMLMECLNTTLSI